MTQGDPLAIIDYGIYILPLIKNLKWVIPDVTKPWYADDAGALGKFAKLETYMPRPGTGVLPQTFQERTDRTPGES